MLVATQRTNWPQTVHFVPDDDNTEEWTFILPSKKVVPKAESKPSSSSTIHRTNVTGPSSECQFADLVRISKEKDINRNIEKLRETENSSKEQSADLRSDISD